MNTLSELQAVYNQRFATYDALMRAHHAEGEWESKPTDSLANFVMEALVARRTVEFFAPVDAEFLASAVALARVSIAIDILRDNSNPKRSKRAQKRALRYARL